ncbi:hypothetical protein GCM10010252_05930 [Streptomyces aureoverticillatus]|nr:hypothetical protein GCM10010252_05930 [Streptomyces aureoverticillatus]
MAWARPGGRDRAAVEQGLSTRPFWWATNSTIAPYGGISDSAGGWPLTLLGTALPLPAPGTGLRTSARAADPTELPLFVSPVDTPSPHMN